MSIGPRCKCGSPAVYDNDSRCGNCRIGGERSDRKDWPVSSKRSIDGIRMWINSNLQTGGEPGRTVEGANEEVRTLLAALDAEKARADGALRDYTSAEEECTDEREMRQAAETARDEALDHIQQLEQRHEEDLAWKHRAEQAEARLVDLLNRCRVLADEWHDIDYGDNASDHQRGREDMSMECAGELRVAMAQAAGGETP